MNNYQMEDSENYSKNDFYENNKKIIWVLIIILAFILIATIVTRNNGVSNGTSGNIAFDNNYDTIMIGSSQRITASNNENDIYEIRYSSSDTSIITVDKYGLVEGVGLGSASLKAYYIDGNGREVYVERKITVFDGNRDINLVSASFSDGDVIMRLYDKYNLGTKIVVTPSNGYVYKKTFKSSNENVVSVDDNGQIVALSEGEAIINVNVNDKFDSNIRVYVLNNQESTEIVQLPDSIEFTQVLLKLKVGGIEKANYILKPQSAIDRYLTWESSNPNIAIVDNGIISALKEGNCDITVKSINGASAKIFVEVTESNDVEKISFKEESIILKENEVYTLSPRVEPSGIINNKLTFTSSNENIARIESSDGTSAVIRALKEGKATIKVKSSNGITSSIKVIVTEKNSTDVSNSDGTISVKINDTITPAKVYSNDIKYTNPANITVTKYGTVKTVKYCYAPYVNAICTPNLVYTSAFKIPSGGIYRLRIQKYDANGREIVGSNYDNYRNGALEYYINTKGDTLYKDIGYSMDGKYYDTVFDANNNIINSNSIIRFNFVNTVTDEIRICYTNNSLCNPDNNPNVIINNNSLIRYINITDDGLWKIYISEYSNGNKVGSTNVYYVKIIKNNYGYTIDGNYYNDLNTANSNPLVGSQRINFNIINSNINKIKVCFTKNETCDPNKTPDKVITGNTISKYIDITESGLWKIFVSEYKNDIQVGTMQTYYLKIK